MPSTLHDIYQSLKPQLIPHDACIIIEHVTGHGQEVFISAPETPVSEDHQAQIDVIVQRHLKGEPLTRILGMREFWGMEFEVTPDVLDPRFDTETLVEAALRWIKQKYDIPSRPRACAHGDKQISILDLGTGTGCIPLALLSEIPNATAVAVDKSPEALDVARNNAEKHKMSNRIKFIQSDWFDALEDQKFDLIVSNPPYISESVIEELDVSVKNHDPFMALSGGESGLECYKIIISNLNDHLNKAGVAFLEIGYDQLESVTRLVDDSNLSLRHAYKDLGGNDRVIALSKEPNGDK